MATIITAKFDDDGALAATEKLRRLVPLAIDFAFKSHGAEFEKEMDKRFTGTLTGELRRNESTDKLANRTGSLRRTVRTRVVKRSGDQVLIASVGSARTAHYVRTQEKGATIRPKRAKYLTIPMPANLTKAGRVRIASPRGVEGGFFFKKGTNLYFGRRVGGQVETLFVLKRQVKIPPRLGFEKTWRSRDMQRDRDTRIDKALAQAFRIAGVQRS